MEFKHEPVMLQECIEGLNIRPDGIYVDGTLGGAGHSKEIAKRINLRNTPELVFEFDESLEYGSRIDEILKDITKDIKH